MTGETRQFGDANPDPSPAGDRMSRRILLAIGPESSGTRVLTRTLSQHPEITGTPDAEHHADLLDDAWALLHHKKEREAAEAIAAHDASVLLTRRSLPHSPDGEHGARFGEFVDIESFARVASAAGRDVTLLITVRDPIANLCSWARSRRSARQNLHSAYAQYRAGIAHIIHSASRLGLPYLVLPLEALMLGGTSYLRGLFQLLDLPPCDSVEYEPKLDVNTQHHDWLSATDFTITASVAVERERAAAFAALTSGASHLIAIAPYPLPLAEHLPNGRSLEFVGTHAPQGWIENERERASSHRCMFRHVDARIADALARSVPTTGATLIAPAFQIHRDSNDRNQLRRSLTALARAITQCDLAIIEFLADEPGQLTRAFLDHVLETVELEDATQQVEAPPPAGRHGSPRDAGDRSVLRYRNVTLVGPVRFAAAVEAYAAMIHATLHPSVELEPTNYRLGTTIDFTTAGTAPAFQNGGWSRPEHKLTWTLGHESALLLGQPHRRPAEEPAPSDSSKSPKPSETDIDLVIDCIAAVFPGSHESQSLEVLVNGDVVFAQQFHQQRNEPIHVEVPAATWSARNPVEVRFRHPDAIAPMEAGAAKGDRPIAFGFRKLTASRKKR